MPDAHYWGEPDQQIFGVYYAPQVERPDAVAVVLCAPGVHEYMTTHWAMRRLASALAKCGAHVLRFDYPGVGDSAGASEECSLDACVASIHSAASHVRLLSKAPKVSLVGFRLGAVFAWMAAQADQLRPRDLVLWDPVIKGADYVREMQAVDAVTAAGMLYPPALVEPRDELRGYPFSAAMRAETTAVDLLSMPLPRATRTHLYVGRESPLSGQLKERLAAQVKRFNYEYVPEEGLAGSGNLLSSRVLQVIAKAVTQERQ